MLGSSEFAMFSLSFSRRDRKVSDRYCVSVSGAVAPKRLAPICGAAEIYCVSCFSRFGLVHRCLLVTKEKEGGLNSLFAAPLLRDDAEDWKDIDLPQ